MPNLLEVANFAFYNTTVVIQYVFVQNPLDQFEIKDFIILYATLFNNLRLSVLNISLYLFVAFILCASLKIVDNKKSIYNYMNLKFSRDSIYTTLHNIVINQINEKKGQNYFPYIFNLFIYILVNNLIGMIPYSFASTSHFLLAFSLSFTIVLGCTLLGLYKNGLPLFALFVPVGCPLALLPLLVIIELISYLARNVSLGLRLAANILSGHMLLNILSGFTCNIMTTGKIFFILGLLPLIFIIAFSGLELTIAFIQAQVFVVLSCSYMKDALELH